MDQKKILDTPDNMRNQVISFFNTANTQASDTFIIAQLTGLLNHIISLMQRVAAMPWQLNLSVQPRGAYWIPMGPARSRLM